MFTLIVIIALAGTLLLCLLSFGVVYLIMSGDTPTSRRRQVHQQFMEDVDEPSGNYRE